MLSSICPLGERARHNRWVVTVASYAVASTVTAALIGSFLGAAGALAGVGLGARLGALAGLAAVAAAVDATGRRPPGVRRQVDEDWLSRYRGWVYGAGFGVQLGAGFATIVNTATVWLTVAAEMLAGSPGAGAVIGAAFGLARAAPLLSTAGTRTHGQLQAHHAALARWGPAAQRTTAAGTALAAGSLGWLALGATGS